MVKKELLIDSLVWGFILWLIGYVLGIVLFFVVPQQLIGWVILPIGLIITFWILLKKVKGTSFNYYLMLSFVWTSIAVAFDYLFIVRMFKPADGYYKPDVYLYYILTFIIPIIVGWLKNKKAKAKKQK